MLDAELPLALSVGDPSGVGPEIAIAAWQARDSAGVPPFYLLADPSLIAARARRLGADVAIVETTPAQAARVFHRALPVVPLVARFVDSPGRPDPANAAGTIEAIGRAAADCLAGRAAAVVTCPIAKKPLYDAGFGFPGHTEYLAHLSARHTGVEAMPVMMLAGPDLRTALLRAVNHSGDSDSTGAIAGNLAGTLYGEAAIPPEWLGPLELRDTIEQVADDFHEAYHGLGVGGEYEEIDDRLSAFLARYPGY